MNMKALVFSIVFALIGISAVAQDVAYKKSNNDPLDLSVQLEQIENNGVPTVSIVNDMKVKAENLYKAGNYAEAAVAYEDFAKKVNWLANLLSQCVEPYYSASYDDKKNISYTEIKNYIPYETKANECKRDRNVAYVMIGVCYKNLGDNSKAVAYLHKALDLLSVDEELYWNIAAKNLSEIVGFVAE